MAIPAVASEFWDTVKRSRLLSEDQVLRLRGQYLSGGELSPAQLAEKLIADKLLTRFQADRLLRGKWRRMVLDAYKILEPLGAGGMGWVYLGEEIATGWKVAIKVLTDKYRENREMFARFRLEAEAGLRLQHPNILRTHGLMTAEDIYGKVYYVVMEFIPGVNLHEYLAIKKRIPWGQACDFAMQTATGLHYAHERGLIHRDIKPENLLLRSNGALKVLDFGLAMVDEKDVEFAMAFIGGQDRLGTADYVAPEQAINSFKVDRRVDIYSLGCTLYFTLTGQVPFPAATPREKLNCHRDKRAQPVREFNPDIPERVELIVRKMMAKQPDHRIATAEEVARYLKPFAERAPVDFDFQALLHARARAAVNRSSAQSSQFGSHASRIEGSKAKLGERPTPDKIDTVIRADTKVDQSPVPPLMLPKPIVPKPADPTR